MNQGALGIPRIEWLEKLHLQARSTKEYLFYDTSLDNCIENAFQALALDENRHAFVPAVWEKSRSSTTVRLVSITSCGYSAYLDCRLCVKSGSLGSIRTLEEATMTRKLPISP